MRLNIFKTIKNLILFQSILRGTWIVFCPDPDELVEMVSTQDGRVSRQVVEVVHDDGHKQVQHLEKQIKNLILILILILVTLNDLIEYYSIRDDTIPSYKVLFKWNIMYYSESPLMWPLIMLSFG